VYMEIKLVIFRHMCIYQVTSCIDVWSNYTRVDTTHSLLGLSWAPVQKMTEVLNSGRNMNSHRKSSQCLETNIYFGRKCNLQCSVHFHHCTNL